MTEPNNIPWKRLTAEGAAIVASILLAFWIDAWWDNRVEQNAFSKNLFALEQEISRNLAHMEERLSRVETNFKKLDGMFQFLNDPDRQILPEELAQDIGQIYSIHGSDLTHSAFDVVMSPGNLRLVKDTELRISIVQTKESITDVDEMFGFLWDDYTDHQAPFLKRHFVISDFGWNEDELLLQQSGLHHPVPAAKFSIDYAALRTREFWNLLYHWRASYLDASRSILEAKEHHQATLALLEREIEKHQ